jgi:hypothetical protein
MRLDPFLAAQNRYRALTRSLAATRDKAERKEIIAERKALVGEWGNAVREKALELDDLPSIRPYETVKIKGGNTFSSYQPRYRMDKQPPQVLLIEIDTRTGKRKSWTGPEFLFDYVTSLRTRRDAAVARARRNKSDTTKILEVVMYDEMLTKLADVVKYFKR